MSDLLEVCGLCKSFGGVLATDAVDLTVREGEVHGLIGPNGAGKTTLLAMLSGMLKPDAGRVVFDGRDVTGKPAYQLCKRGLSRSFQITSVFDELTVRDNVAIAIQARSGHSFKFWKPVASDARVREPALQYLTSVGLQDKPDSVVSLLSHGERRQLEIAMALATEPKLLLLDEPMAGMGVEESREMGELLLELKGQVSVLLVEHDMQTVFTLADRISVLVYGKIIATGTAAEIRASAEVQRAYLGDEYSDLSADVASGSGDSHA